MKERLNKPSPIIHHQTELSTSKPFFANKKPGIGGVSENDAHAQVLTTNLQTDQDALGNNEKGKVNLNYETTDGPVNDSKTGYFRWVVKWLTNGTSGWIVQKMESTYDETLANGNKRTEGLPTTTYWEAWQVGPTGAIVPTPLDYWQRGYIQSKDAEGTKGTWSIKGTAYFTQNDITKQGFKKKNVPDAGLLLSTTSDPGKLGKKLVKREKMGSWDATTK